MNNNNNKPPVAKIIVHRVNGDNIVGMAITVDGAVGWSMYLKTQTTKQGKTMYGGYMSRGFSPQQGVYPPSDFYISLLINEDVNKNYLFTAFVKKVFINGNDKTFADEPTFIGYLYPSGVSGLATGLLFMAEPRVAQQPPPQQQVSGWGQQPPPLSQPPQSNSLPW